jgi:hypothetical protein
MAAEYARDSDRVSVVSERVPSGGTTLSWVKDSTSMTKTSSAPWPITTDTMDSVSRDGEIMYSEGIMAVGVGELLSAVAADTRVRDAVCLVFGWTEKRGSARRGT